MSNSTTTHTRVTRVARRISSSSGARVLEAHFAPCILDLLGHARGGGAPKARRGGGAPMAHVAMESLIC
jgi:hypothetical protein